LPLYELHLFPGPVPVPRLCDAVGPPADERHAAWRAGVRRELAGDAVDAGRLPDHADQRQLAVLG